MRKAVACCQSTCPCTLGTGVHIPIAIAVPDGFVLSTQAAAGTRSALALSWGRKSGCRQGKACRCFRMVSSRKRRTPDNAQPLCFTDKYDGKGMRPSRFQDVAQTLVTRAPSSPSLQLLGLPGNHASSGKLCAKERQLAATHDHSAGGVIFSNSISIPVLCCRLLCKTAL